MFHLHGTMRNLAESRPWKSQKFGQIQSEVLFIRQNFIFRIFYLSENVIFKCFLGTCFPSLQCFHFKTQHLRTRIPQLKQSARKKMYMISFLNFPRNGIQMVSFQKHREDTMGASVDKSLFCSRDIIVTSKKKIKIFFII